MQRRFSVKKVFLDNFGCDDLITALTLITVI